jgi:hypothetical protein
MAHAPLSGRPDIGPAAQAIDRRRFLWTGAGCVVPLLAGTTLGRTAPAWPLAAPVQTSETDAILNHINRELLKACKGMQRVAGIKGEHVRVMAANLDLMAAHLIEKGQDRQLEAALKDGVNRSGRDGFAQELLARQAEVIAATAKQHGIANRVRLDLMETAAALDVALRQGFAPVLHRSAPRLAALAAAIDRARERQGAVVRTAGQKAGDDFLLYGSQPEPVLTCRDLRVLMYLSAIASAVFGIASFGVTSGVYALGSLLASMLYDWLCTVQEAI